MRKWSFTKCIFLLVIGGDELAARLVRLKAHQLRWSTFLLLLTEVIVYVFLENLSKAVRAYISLETLSSPSKSPEWTPLSDRCDAISRANASRAFIVLIEVDGERGFRLPAKPGVRHLQRSRKLLWINALLMVVVAICSAVIVAKYFPQDHCKSR